MQTVNRLMHQATDQKMASKGCYVLCHIEMLHGYWILYPHHIGLSAVVCLLSLVVNIRTRSDCSSQWSFVLSLFSICFDCTNAHVISYIGQYRYDRPNQGTVWGLNSSSIHFTPWEVTCAFGLLFSLVEKLLPKLKQLSPLSAKEKGKRVIIQSSPLHLRLEVNCWEYLPLLLRWETRQVMDGTR